MPGTMVIRASVHSQAEPVADAAAAPITIRRRRQALLGGFLLTLAALWIAVPLRGPLLDTSAAVPDLSVPGRAPGPLLVPGEPRGSEQRAQEDRQALFDALNQVVEDARAKLEKLTEATATMAADTEVLVGQIRLNEQLNKSLARADASRQAAIAETERTRGEMARKLEAATDAAAQSRADLAGLHKELEANDNELATAESAREEAERARQAMSNEAESLRSEAARARDELSAAKTEIARLKTANAELERELSSWRTFWTSAIETARQKPIMMEEMIEEVNAALHLAPPEEATPAASAPTMPAPPEKKPVASESTKPAAPEDERSAATQASSITQITQPRAPEPVSETGAGQPADSPIDRSATELSMAGSTAAPEEADSRLAGFRASIEVWTVDPSGRREAEAELEAARTRTGSTPRPRSCSERKAALKEIEGDPTTPPRRRSTGQARSAGASSC
jgi:hypothetical protein